MLGVGEHQRERLLEDVPHRLPVHARRLHRYETCSLPRSATPPAHSSTRCRGHANSRCSVRDRATGRHSHAPVHAPRVKESNPAHAGDTGLPFRHLLIAGRWRGVPAGRNGRPGSVRTCAGGPGSRVRAVVPGDPDLGRAGGPRWGRAQRRAAHGGSVKSFAGCAGRTGACAKSERYWQRQRPGSRGRPDPGDLPGHERESGSFPCRHDGPGARCLPERGTTRGVVVLRRLGHGPMPNSGLASRRFTAGVEGRMVLLGFTPN